MNKDEESLYPYISTEYDFSGINHNAFDIFI